MKTRMMIALLTLALAAPAAYAFQIGVFGGSWDQDEGDRVNGGGVLFLLDALPLEIRGTYYEEATVHGAGDLEALPVDVGLVLGLPFDGPVSVSLVGGGSYYFIDADRRNVDDEIGWYAGGRLKIPLRGDLSLFGEVLYRGVEVDDVDAELDGVAFNIGLIFW